MEAKFFIFDEQVDSADQGVSGLSSLVSVDRTVPRVSRPSDLLAEAKR